MKLIIAVTGASGSIYARTLLNQLSALRTSHKVLVAGVVFSEKGKKVWAHETGAGPTGLPFKVYNNDDFDAPFASGSSLCDAMIVCPCSVGTVGRIAGGLADTLIARAADVMLKERRRLILAVRETPLHLIHLRNMELLTQAGAIIAPASPSFYSHPKTIEELAKTVTDRLLQLAGVEIETYRWGKSDE